MIFNAVLVRDSYFVNRYNALISLYTKLESIWRKNPFELYRNLLFFIVFIFAFFVFCDYIGLPIIRENFLLYSLSIIARVNFVSLIVSTVNLIWTKDFFYSIKIFRWEFLVLCLPLSSISYYCIFPFFSTLMEFNFKGLYDTSFKSLSEINRGNLVSGILRIFNSNPLTGKFTSIFSKEMFVHSQNRDLQEFNRINKIEFVKIKSTNKPILPYAIPHNFMHPIQTIEKIPALHIVKGTLNFKDLFGAEKLINWLKTININAYCNINLKLPNGSEISVELTINDGELNKVELGSYKPLDNTKMHPEKYSSYSSNSDLDVLMNPNSQFNNDYMVFMNNPNIPDFTPNIDDLDKFRAPSSNNMQDLLDKLKKNIQETCDDKLKREDDNLNAAFIEHEKWEKKMAVDLPNILRKIQAFEVFLPEDKLEVLQVLITSWNTKVATSARENVTIKEYCSINKNLVNYSRDKFRRLFSFYTVIEEELEDAGKDKFNNLRDELKREVEGKLDHHQMLISNILDIEKRLQEIINSRK